MEDFHDQPNGMFIVDEIIESLLDSRATQESIQVV
jgi:hypothetical protein